MFAVAILSYAFLAFALVSSAFFIVASNIFCASLGSSTGSFFVSSSFAGSLLVLACSVLEFSFVILLNSSFTAVVISAGVFSALSLFSKVWVHGKLPLSFPLVKTNF